MLPMMASPSSPCCSEGGRSSSSSRSGFSVISCWSMSASSRVDMGRSLIACWSEGVNMSFCWSFAGRVSFCCKSFPYASVQPEVFAEVDCSDVLVLRELRGRSGAENLPIVHYIGSIGDLQSFSNVVIGHQDSDSAGFQMMDDLLDVPDGDGVDSRKGLVEEHEGGRRHQGAGDLGAPSFSTRERVSPRSRLVRKSQLLQHFAEPLPFFVRPQRKRLENRKRALLDRAPSGGGR